MNTDSNDVERALRSASRAVANVEDLPKDPTSETLAGAVRQLVMALQHLMAEVTRIKQKIES
jgi:hypothetical protein